MDNKIVWGGDDPYTHMLVVGPTRTGKTATILKPIIYNLLVQKARGKPLGLSVIEPKGGVAFMVREMCEEMGLDFVHIDPSQKRGYAVDTGYDPSYESHRFNPMIGDEDTVAEATVAVLKSLFGKQEAFFATVQEVSARNVTKLLKRLHGDRIDLGDVVNTLRDLKLLEYKVNELIHRQGEDDLTKFFKTELLGAMKDKYRQFVIGLRAQLENLTANSRLRTIMTGQSSFDMDRHFEKGGILAVNTALGELGTSGDAFGQYIIMHLQAGTFRRGGTEKTRVPHFLIVDEYSRYINPDIERFLNIAAEYRVAGIFACQSLSQLEVETGKMSGKAVKRAIINGCRNKICFGGISAEDAKEFAEEFGKKQIIVRQATYDTKIIGANLFPSHYRDTEQEEYRFFYTQLMDGLPRFHFVYKLVQNGTPQPPKIGRGRFVPRDWKKQREWETTTRQPKGLMRFFARKQSSELKKETVPKLIRHEIEIIPPKRENKTRYIHHEDPHPIFFDETVNHFRHDQGEEKQPEQGGAHTDREVREPSQDDPETKEVSKESQNQDVKKQDNTKQRKIRQELF